MTGIAPVASFPVAGTPSGGGPPPAGNVYVAEQHGYAVMTPTGLFIAEQHGYAVLHNVGLFVAEQHAYVMMVKTAARGRREIMINSI